MKKLIAICFVTLFFCAGASAQTTSRTKPVEKKPVKAKVVKDLQSKTTKAKLRKATETLRKEGN